eukprot:Gb_12551 [translate_table: standard]
MAVANPLTNGKNKIVLFVGLLVQFGYRKTTTSVVKIEGNGISSSVPILCKQGRLKEALHILYEMDHSAISSTYVCLLQSCLKKKTLPEGKLVHAHIIQTGFECRDIHLGNTVVNMYAKCGSLMNARRVFDQMPEQDVASWTIMIAAYPKQGYSEEALALFYKMQRSGIQPNQFTFASVLPACANLSALEHGKKIHEYIIKSEFQSDVFVASALIDMYAKCGSLVNAYNVFDKMPRRDVVSWNAIIAGYAQNGHASEALTLFHKMQRTGIQPDQFTFASVLPACDNLAAVKEFHEEIIRSGFESDAFVMNALVDMYGKRGSIESAHCLFEKMPKKNVISWTAMIAGYAQNGYLDEAKNLFDKMPERNVVSWNAMIVGYAQNGLIGDALKLFQNMPERDLVSWNAMITGYAQNGFVDEALELFDKMPQRDAVSWNAMIAGYSQNGHVDEAMQLFQKMPQRDMVSWNSMIAGYAQNGCVDEARKLFQNMPERDVVSWNSMIAGYALNGQVDEALKLFYEIPRSNVVSWNTMIAGYAQNGHVEDALELFQKMPDRNIVSWNTMIAVYVQNGYVNKALKLFQKMPNRDVISWTAMIAGYAQNGQGEEALKLFRQMQVAGVKPDSETFANILPACANMAALEQGKEVHDFLIKSGFQSNVFVGSALIDMYAKCGSIQTARNVFEKMPQGDIVLWSAMIVGYAMHGYGNEALQLFEQMQDLGMNPDHVTFVGVLSACCHAGLVDKGWQYFNCISEYYHITPAMEHYGCMVDILGRAGHLDEAQNFINRMPMKPDAAVWGCLLAACRIHNNLDLGECVAERLFELDPKNAAPYVLLSNIYAAAGRWDDIEKVRKIMKDRRVKKKPGCSWIEINKQMYVFVVGDRSHPQMQKIYAELERLSGQMNAAGYVFNSRFALNDVDEEQKQQNLCHHSEKLAIACGLINTSPGTPIRVIKNLRVCGDCHSAIKFISKIVMREIVVRDANRFHHFKDGRCSCGDYW